MRLSHYICGVALILSCTATAHADVASGYEKTAWGTEFAKVVKKYPKGTIAKTGEDMVVYRQTTPARNITRRLFGFRNGRLYTVSVTFDKGYVQKKGLENMLAEQKKKIGEAKVDSSQAPHMVSCAWEGKDTKITFAYAPKRPDMTVIMYDQKQ